MRAYCAFSSLSFVVYCFPAHWINCGWLRQMGAVDIAGCGPVHVVGGTAALVAAWFLGPREGCSTFLVLLCLELGCTY